MFKIYLVYTSWHTLGKVQSYKTPNQRVFDAFQDGGEQQLQGGAGPGAINPPPDNEAVNDNIPPN
jgi:hypothetical protein